MASKRSSMSKMAHMSTGAILNRLQANKDRQRALILGVFASVVAIMVFIIVLERPPSEPPSTAPAQQEPEHRKTRPPQRSHATPPSPPEEPAPPAPATPVVATPSSLRVHITCTRGWGLWIDQRKFGTCKTMDLDLSPGSHQLMARRGRHMLTETIQLDSAVAVRVDGTRRKITVQKLP